MSPLMRLLVLLAAAFSVVTRGKAQFPTGRVSFQDAQWLKAGLYSALAGQNRLLFFTDTDCRPHVPPDSIAQTKDKPMLLIWDNPAGTVCIAKLVERASDESNPGSAVLWAANKPNTIVTIDEEDRVTGRSIVNGSEAIVVDSPIRLDTSSFGFNVSIVSMASGDVANPDVEHVSVFVLGSDFTENRLETHGTGKVFVCKIPAPLQHGGFPLLVKLNRGGNVFLFQTFVPAVASGRSKPPG